MTASRHDRMLRLLADVGGWMSAADLADRLGVTPRSVRSYVAAVKAENDSLIDSSPEGYRLRSDSYREYRQGPGSARERGGPQHRIHRLVQRLANEPAGVDVFDVAGDAFVSESTVEADLGRLRATLEGTGLSLSRHGSVVQLGGPETEVRRLLSNMFRSELDDNPVDLAGVQREFSAGDLSAFKDALMGRLDGLGYFVNEYGINDVLLHVAITLERVAGEHSIENVLDAAGARAEPDAAQATPDAAGPAGPANPAGPAGPTAPARPNDPPGPAGPGPAGPIEPDAGSAHDDGAGRPDDPTTDGRPSAMPELALGALPELIGDLVSAHFAIDLADLERNDLAFLLRSRVLTTRAEHPEDLAALNYVPATAVESVRQIVRRASDEYLVDLDDEAFIARLAVHVRNLVSRARRQSYSHNPMARSIKTSYPMTYELAVFIASALSDEHGIAVTDDEIAYIAMHVGALLIQQKREVELVSCSIVCPNYYDLHALLRNRIEREFADDLHVVSVSTRVDTDWAALDGEIVLSTIAPAAPEERIIVIQPFPTVNDMERIREAVTRVRRVRRRRAVRDDLLQYFDPRLFFRNVEFGDASATIAALGRRMIDAGVIDEAYVAGAIARERMSSTAFTDTLAVPHAMTMTAARTTIAIVLNDQASEWGENRVNVVALIAFSESGRQQFQSVFDQFVEVFSERDDVLTLIRRSDSFEAFIDELARMMNA